MIGKPEWFQRRKFTGWGFSPRTWQGWVYIAVLVGLMMGIQVLPVSGEAKTMLMIIYSIIFAIDAIDIMLRLRKDERETRHEAIAERNVAWFMVTVMAIGIAYQAASSAVAGNVGFLPVDPILLIALFGGLVVKIATNLYLEHKE